jgi:hypothetical protein
MAKTYVKLTKEQKAEIVNLSEKGKSATEIISFLKEKYKVDFLPAKIYYTIKQHGGVSSAGKKGKKGKKSGAKSSEAQSASGEIIKLVERLERANSAIFTYLRTSLIKKLQEKHKVMTKEEIPISDGDEITPDEERESR